MNRAFAAASYRGLLSRWTAFAFIGAIAACSAATAGESLWRQLAPKKRVDADPKADYTLTERNGPWLIMAASFHGEEGERDARELVLELRGKFNLTAYYYAMTFDRDDLNPGRGIDEYGGRIKRKYQSGDHELEHAVLVGDFPTIDDQEAQNLLDRVKTLEPESLKTDPSENNTQNLATVRTFYKQVRQSFGKPTARGPMGHAFMTRNPILPVEYFTGGGVDADIAKWNEGLEYSLLHCPGKYSIRVATFKGRSTLASAKDEGETKVRTRIAKENDPLVVAGENAHKLAVALRARGWEAYEFHDRHESYVAVGSFNDMQRGPDGRLSPAGKDAQIVINTFSAATPESGFDGPEYKALGIKDGDIAKVERKEDEILKEFNSRFSAAFGRTTGGLNPKRFVGLPFDIYPEPIVAPKKSLGGAYARN
jgi:hypothetical protein